MILNIISPTYNKKLNIAWLEVNTNVGNFVIQPGHAPIILTLMHNKNVTYCLTTGKQETITINQGIVDIGRTEATMILNESK